MSTHANIIIKEKKGNIFVIHVWYDGYEEALGNVLENRSIENLYNIISPEILLEKNQSIKTIYINEAKNINFEIMDRPGINKYSKVTEIPVNTLLDGSEYQYIVGLNHKEKEHLTNSLLNNNLLDCKIIILDKFYPIDFERDLIKNYTFDEAECKKAVSKIANNLDYSNIKIFKENIGSWQVKYGDFLKNNYLINYSNMSNEQANTFNTICNDVIKSEFNNRQKEKKEWLLEEATPLSIIEIFDAYLADDSFVKTINEGIEKITFDDNMNFLKNRIGLFEKEEFFEMIKKEKEALESQMPERRR